ncbi:phage virion morphogenesis protein [Pantoea agglomerans]|uniref:phage virion morphogenesis protein n=1 Tax=Enterobacter agglomerans TaxID=549 RepID=UPI003D166A37
MYVGRSLKVNGSVKRDTYSTTWEPPRVSARSKKGRIRRGMFAKLKTAKYLKAQAGADAAEVAFVPGVQRLARVHHYGMRDRVSRRGPVVKYTQRSLLGINTDMEGEAIAIVMGIIRSESDFISFRG